MSMHDFIARAYEKACADAMRAVELMPPYVPPKRTVKQRIRYWWRGYKYQAGRQLYKVCNRLGYYDDSY